MMDVENLQGLTKMFYKLFVNHDPSSDMPWHPLDGPFPTD